MKKKSSLRTFFRKIKTFEIVNFHGLQNMVFVLSSPINSDLSHRYCHRYSVSNLQFFSRTLLLLRVITAIRKYILWQNYILSRPLLQSSLSFKFESFLSNLAKMAAILNFCQICQKGILFTFCFAICILLAVYFSKYLIFPLSTIRICQNNNDDDVLVENSGSWKCEFFFFGIFFSPTLEDFIEKTYEKTYRFYNIFSKYYSKCARLPNFTRWIFFSKICWPFQFNVHIFRFPTLLQENL